eukprot:TRINITY_DN1127_c0_g1_i2.p1 TRINITY_DN1127_c0_g1~~TRINITY_DN1127_c0_g1_i2.p1  ORF type:complete len:748 (-),score=267.99 TRINITY_DN1127_c0_g1_i2:59-2236(-)
MATNMLRLALVALCLVAPAAAGNPKGSSAVIKVIEMMEDLRKKVEAEGEAEKVSYEKYAGWCSDTESEKDGEIKLGKENIAELKAAIETGEAEKEKQTDAISGEGGFVETIAKLEKKIKEDIATRKAEKKTYDAANKDTEKAIDGLTKAIKAMKAGEAAGTALLQDGTRHQLRAAALLAETMGFQGSETLHSLAGPGEADYDYHSGGIIETLENLLVEFKDADTTADEEEAKTVNSFTNSQNALNSDLENNKRNLETAKEAKGAAIAKVGQAKKDKDEAEAELADDEKYREELIAMCEEKKATFDQRVSTRTEELAALDEATQIIKDTTGQAGGDALLFEVAKKAVKVPAVLMTAESDAEKIEKEDGVVDSFVQTESVHRHHVMRTVRFLRGRHATGDKRQQAYDLLMRLAEETHKGRFVAFAQKAAKMSAKNDVFAEIKRMIADQIDRLKDTAAASQDKKLSCDKRISESSIKRDNADKEVKTLNTKMMSSEARRDELSEDIDRLTDEINLLAEQVKNATDARNKDSEENKADIEEAKIALSGVDAAMKVIRDFYGKNAENEVALAQKETGPAKDAPDAGFKNKEANKGSQSASTGIIGMLEVIQDDFKRSIKETTEAEEKAAKEHTKFLGEADISTSEKKTAVDAKSKFLAETVEQLDEETSSMNTQLTTLRSAVEELAVLDEECGSQISYEERKAAREEEIQALQEAVDRINLFIATQIPAR